jgi:hypothetical protein
MFDIKLVNVLCIFASLTLTEVESLAVSQLAQVSSNASVQTGKLFFVTDLKVSISNVVKL